MNSAAPDGGPGRPLVLVLDDDPGIITLLQLGLSRYGFDTLTATTGAEAVALLRRESPRVDLALLDLQLSRTNGPAVLRELRAIDPGLRCCFMSGDCGTLTPDELHDLRACDLIQKPFHWTDLVARLRDCLASPRPDRRWHPRRAGAPVMVDVMPGGNGIPPTPGRVVDRSPGGLRLAFTSAPPAADRLRVRRADRPETAVEVEVRHRRPHEGGWLVGCQFVAPVPDGLLAAFD